MNDIVITRRGSLQINSYNIFVNEKHLHCYHADGILVATPTGSTGYNLSAGGPIVNPCARLMVLTPICPHSMQNRSIVFSAEDQIRIEVEERREPVPAGGIEVIFDGGHQITLKAGDRVEIETQDELAEKLKEAGFDVTQATVSRDIRELKLTKVPTGNGRQKYTILVHSDHYLSDKYIRVLKDGYVSMDVAQNILVVKTVSGMAMAVAAAIDAIKLKEIVGCIAGDDTIMLVLHSEADAIKTMENIKEAMES